MSRPTRHRILAIFAFALTVLAVAVIFINWQDSDLDAAFQAEQPQQKSPLDDDDVDVDGDGDGESTQKKFDVVINRPSFVPQVDTGSKDIDGHAVTVACATCHATREPNVENRATKDLDQFHAGLKIQHGQLTCLSCHNSNNYNSLRLADGTELSFSDSMQLCAQCHGPQFRDYQNGSHGGMTGYWDLNRGPRQRNHCTDCHDPHWPEFQKMLPVFAPRDRFPAAKAHH